MKIQDRPERRVVPVDGLDGCTLTVREPTNRERYAQYFFAREVCGDNPSDSDWQSAVADFRTRVIVDWSGFNGEDGQPLQFNPRTFGMALAQIPRLALVAQIASRDAFMGLSEQDSKNSETPSSNG